MNTKKQKAPKGDGEGQEKETGGGGRESEREERGAEREKPNSFNLPRNAASYFI